MNRLYQLVVFALVSMMVFAMLPALSSPVAVRAQSSGTVEEAVKQTVAASTGVDSSAVTVAVVAEDGDWYYGTATDADISVSIFLAHRTDDGFEVALRYDDDFHSLLATAPADFPTADIRASFESFSLAGDSSADLSLPWPVGEHRRISNAHEYPFMTFYPVTYGSSTFEHNLPILAMRSGTIYFPCSGVAMIDHGDGYATFYNYLASSPFSAGQTVQRGQRIGNTTSTPTCRSTGTGNSVEIWITLFGQRIEFHNIEIGGYSFSTSEGGINGPFTCASGPGFTDCTIYNYRDGIPNLGLHGEDAWPNATITLDANNPRLYLISGFPPSTLVTMTWQRPDGARLPMGTIMTNAGGSAYGIYDYPDSGSGSYTRNNMLVAQAGTLTRMAEVTAGNEQRVTTGISYSQSTGNYSTIAGQLVTVSGQVADANLTMTIRAKDAMNAVYPLPGTVTSDALGRYVFSFVVPMMAEGSATTELLDANNNVMMSISYVVQYTKVVLLSSNSGQGGALDVELKGFAPNTTYSLRGYTPYSTPPPNTTFGSVTTNAQGNAVLPITMYPGYNYTSVDVYLASTFQSGARYYYEERAWLSAASAAPGSAVTLHGLSFGKTVTKTISWHNGVAWVDLATGTSDAAGTIAIPFTVPATATPGSTMFIRILGGSYYFSNVALQITSASAQPLVANAGTDQTTSTGTGTKSITLSGSGSTPSASITSYRWKRAGIEIATTANPTVTLPVGTHELVLTVTDNLSRIAVDSVIIRITNSSPPSAQFAASNAVPGATVGFSVSNFPASTQVKLFAPSTAGNGTALATVTTNANGAATGQFTVPTLPGGQPLTFDFSASAGLATATLTIDPLFAMYSVNPLIWTKLGQIRASGFAANAPMTLEYQSGSQWIAIPLTTPNTSSAGTSTSTFTVPNTIAPEVATFRLTTGSVTQTTTHQVYASTPPSAYISTFGSQGTATTPQGYQLFVDGRQSTDSDGSIQSWVWFDNGIQVASGSTANVWLQVGAHDIKIVVTDNTGATDEFVRSFTVLNAIPVANIATISSSIAASDSRGVQVTLNGAASTDGNGPLASYLWKDNGVDIGTGQTLTAWFQVGTHPITLIVTDSHGATDDATRTFAVTNPLPVANAGPDQTLSPNGSPSTVSVTLDGRLSSDANGSIVSYVWTKGGVEIANGANPTVSIPASSTTITLTVTDQHGATRTDSVSITISPNSAPTVSAVVTGGAIKFTTAAQLQVTLDGSSTSDAQDADSAMTFVWTKGSTELGRGVTLPVTLAQGTHDILLTVTDTNGATGSKTIQVIIANPPTANAGPDQTVSTADFGTYVNLTGSLSANVGGGSLTYAWYRNNSWLSSGANPEVYLATGTHTLELRVTHSSGQIFTDQVVISVLQTQPVDPSVTFSASSGSVGSTITVTIVGFEPNRTVSMYWYRPNGTQATGLGLPTFTTNASGEASGTFTVPAVVGGANHSVDFDDWYNYIEVPFEVKPRIVPSVASAAPGQSITLNLSGFAANNALTIAWQVGGTWVNVGTATSSAAGSVSNKSIKVPANATGGPNTIRVSGTISAQSTAVSVISPFVSISPLRTTVNNTITYSITSFPANTSVTITWRRLTGSTIAIGTVTTDASGAATGQFKVPATTGGPNQQITFAGGGVTRTVLFEVAPRIKSNTSPGLRGQKIDVSLRGFAAQQTVTIKWKNPATGSFVVVGSGKTSNTGSANIWVTVPGWAADGNHSVRAETASFNQQTNTVLVQGGATFRLSEDVSPTPTPEATSTPDESPAPEATPAVEPEATPTVEATPVVDPTATPEPTPDGTPTPEATETPATPDTVPAPAPAPEVTPEED